MGRCSAINCYNHSGTQHRMFRFRTDEERRKKRAINCRRKNFKPTNNHQLCNVNTISLLPFSLLILSDYWYLLI